MQVVRRRRRHLFRSTTIAILVLADALSLGGCCWDCGRLSRIGAVASTGPSSAPEGPFERVAPSATGGKTKQGFSAGFPGDEGGIPAGGEPVGSGFYVN